MNNWTYPTCFGHLGAATCRIFLKTYALVVSYYVQLLVDILIVRMYTL